ncbi:MAG: hypothetical protein GX625_08090 [Clostridiaceae bacterium]|nr:hypothetical protein [Clostridiaceae bacterium]
MKIFLLLLPWIVLTIVGKMVKTFLYEPYMEAQEDIMGVKIRGALEKLLNGFISFLVIGTLMDLHLLPEATKDNIWLLLYYLLLYSSPIMIVMFIVVFIKTRKPQNSLILVLIIYGMGVLLIPYYFFLLMKWIGKKVLGFLGFTFKEALDDSATSGQEYRCPKCGAQIYQSGECESCGSYITVSNE